MLAQSKFPNLARRAWQAPVHVSSILSPLYCDLRDNDEELRIGNNRGTFRALLAEMVNAFASPVLFYSRSPLGRVMICLSLLPALGYHDACHILIVSHLRRICINLEQASTT